MLVDIEWGMGHSFEASPPRGLEYAGASVSITQNENLIENLYFSVDGHISLNSIIVFSICRSFTSKFQLKKKGIRKRIRAGTAWFHGSSLQKTHVSNSLLECRCTYKDTPCRAYMSILQTRSLFVLYLEANSEVKLFHNYKLFKQTSFYICEFLISNK